MIITDFMLGKKAIKFKIKFTLNIYIYIIQMNNITLELEF